MLAERLLTLAAQAGWAVVASVATDAWDTTSYGFTQLLGQGDAQRIRLAELRLEETREQLTGVAGTTTGQTRVVLAERWEGRLADLLEERPDAEADLREHGFLRPGVSIDMDALRAFLAPLADPSRYESFKFSREWMRGEAARVTDLRGASVARQLNLPPSYILIHRVSTAGIGVLCQLEAQGEFRSEVLRWMPGYGPDDLTGGLPVDDEGPGALGLALPRP